MAEQFYGDIGMKQSRDIDLLVERENIKKCDELLREHGCIRIQPDFTLTPKQEKVHCAIIHHCTYLNKKNNTIIELHWRLLSPPAFMPLDTSSVIQRSVKIKWEKRYFNILNDDDQLLYLAAHGSKHQWYRIYWLKDFAEALYIYPESRYKHLIEKAKNNNMLAPLLQGVLLSNILFDYELPDAFIPLINNKHYRLARSALSGIKKTAEKNLSRKFSRIFKIFYVMQLKNDFKYKWQCIWSLRTVENDWKIIKLPDKLFFLYYFLRPFLWFYEVYLMNSQARQ
jgi:hypothetical protein